MKFWMKIGWCDRCIAFFLKESIVRITMQNATLAILTQNEEAYIDQCLRYHKTFFDFIIILDGNSSDRTVEIANDHDRVIVWKEEDNFDGFAARRNYLAEKCVTDFILMVDADELFDLDFLRNMDKYVAKESTLRKKEVVAFNFPRINLDNEHPIDYHVRLYMKDVCEWEGRVHETLVLKETREHVDQAKINEREICQRLDGHYIIHLQKPKEERLKQRERWRRLNDRHTNE